MRSSACAEDSNDASYAGQQETYLFVETFDEVMEKVVECWLSFFSERALFYREHKGDLDDIQMAVVVQQMVDATKAGVMFTVDPVNHRKDRVVVEAALGIGENVVSGEVTPDYYTLDRKGALKKARVVEEQVIARVRARRAGQARAAPRRPQRQPAGHRVGLRRHRPVHAAVPPRHHHVAGLGRPTDHRAREETTVTWHMPTTVDEVAAPYGRATPRPPSSRAAPSSAS